MSWKLSPKFIFWNHGRGCNVLLSMLIRLYFQAFLFTTTVIKSKGHPIYLSFVIKKYWTLPNDNYCLKNIPGPSDSTYLILSHEKSFINFITILYTGDSLLYHDNMLFSTYDADNDQNGFYNCALGRLGGWWYNSCHKSNLNGEYSNTDNSNGINWHAWMGFEYSMTEVRMMLRNPTLWIFVMVLAIRVTCTTNINQLIKIIALLGGVISTRCFMKCLRSITLLMKN